MRMSKFVIAAGAAMIAAPMASAQETVKIGDFTWTGSDAIGHVIAAVINGPLGSEAVIVEGLSDGDIVAAGMHKGDGSVDVYPDLWMPNRQPVWDEYVDGAGTVGVNIPYEGTQKIYVPSYMASTASSIEDLADPAVAALFDTDGDGKGEYWAGDATWSSTKMWQVKFKSYGLSDLWEPNIIPDATFKAQLEAAYNRQAPMLFYYWTPEWVHAAYDLTPIAEPATYEGCLNKMDLSAEDWLEVSEFDCASANATIYVAYSKSLEERNPPVAKFLSQLALDPATVNQWILQIGRDEEDPVDVAEAWVEDNMDIVNSWIQ